MRPSKAIPIRSPRGTRSIPDQEKDDGRSHPHPTVGRTNARFWYASSAQSLRPCLWTSEGASVGFAKVLLLDLSHCVAGDVAGHKHAFWLLVFREIARNSGLDLLFVDFGSGLRSHNRHHGLAEIGVRYANHGAFSDARHGLNGRFNFRGIDVVAARDDEVLGAS